jgi:hypothetical protein
MIMIDIVDYDGSDPLVTDHTLQSIAEHCSGRIKPLSLSYCRYITDAGLMTIFFYHNMITLGGDETVIQFIHRTRNLVANIQVLRSLRR